MDTLLLLWCKYDVFECELGLRVGVFAVFLSSCAEEDDMSRF